MGLGYLPDCNIRNFQGNPSVVLADFTKAKKLKETTFDFGACHTLWVVNSLKTITPEHREFRHISIHFPYSSRRRIEGNIHKLWLDLDQILVQLWESHAVRVNALCSAGVEVRKRASEWVGVLLPETTKRGIIKIVHSS